MEISINFDFVQSAGERPFQPFELGGDTMASVHIIKDRELLSNLRRADQSITVIGLAGKQTASIIGDFGPFKSPFLKPRATSCHWEEQLPTEPFESMMHTGTKTS